jgi:hypothetical protein
VEVGCKQLINAGNWRPGDVGLAQDCEYYSYTSTDVIARNNYTGGFHRGVTDGWQVLSGNMYTDVSMTKNPLALPSNVKQPLGHPYIVPETLWVPPDLYRSEAPLMMAAQQASPTGMPSGTNRRSPSGTSTRPWRWGSSRPPR